MQRDFDNIKDIDRLEQIYGEWLAENDFDDSYDTLSVRHAYTLTNSQREWLDDFDAAWRRMEEFEDKVLRLATAFSRNIRAALEPEELQEAVVRNLAESSAGVCHTHDFLDANMIMDAAFSEAFGREREDEDPETGEEPEDFAIWSAAWMLAKRNGFGMKA